METVEIAALGVIIVGRDRAVAPTEEVAQGIAGVRQARAQVSQGRGVAQAASAILVAVQAPGREVVVTAAPAQELVGIPVVLAPVVAQAQAKLEALAAVVAEAAQVVVLEAVPALADQATTAAAEAQLAAAITEAVRAEDQAQAAQEAAASRDIAPTATARTE